MNKMTQSRSKNNQIFVYLLICLCPRMITGQETPLQRIAQEPELSIANETFNAEGLSEVFQENINGPNFGGIICVPTDDAFTQFFDDTEISQDVFLSTPDLVNSFVGSNLIPAGGVQGGMPGPGEARVANTFIKGEQLQIFRNDQGQVAVTSPSGSFATVQRSIQQGNATIWTLDAVLQSQELVRIIQDLMQIDDVLSIVNGDPELTTLAQLLQSDQISDVAAQEVFDPSFGGIICAPTDSAFLQFFDEQEVNQQEQKSNQAQEIQSLIDLHIIPWNGIPGGVPMACQTKQASTLDSGKFLTVSRSCEGQVSVKDPRGDVASVVDNIKVGNATVWKLDAVLQPNQNY
eukprot:TRINITY_DN7488_c0_g4_i2.p1 TRINITY_DN7488_c0_g4~~TRINITY_DN7488_c0_g4_i2.p1  ORF type:complete len:347 (-),score=29.73 TRINITY_DN7488_c0_g4_i2:667-1707(-)